MYVITMAIIISIFPAALVTCAAADIAGGMIHQTMKGVEGRDDLMNYVGGPRGEHSRDVLEKDKEYYLASADKTYARLELARSRVDASCISAEDKAMLNGHIDRGEAWVSDLKSGIRSSEGSKGFSASVSEVYDAWHIVKMIPQAAEGYAITKSIQGRAEDIRAQPQLAPEQAAMLDRAETLNERAMSGFLEILNLDTGSDLKKAESLRVESYNQASEAHTLIEHALKETSAGK